MIKLTIITIIWSVMDLVVTLSQLANPSFLELNPIANYIIKEWGKIDLAIFKIGITLLFVAYIKFCWPFIDLFWKKICSYSVSCMIIFWAISWGHYFYFSV